MPSKPELPKLIEEALETTLDRNRKAMLEFLARLEVKDQVHVLYTLFQMSKTLRDNLDKILEGQPSLEAPAMVQPGQAPAAVKTAAAPEKPGRSWDEIKEAMADQTIAQRGEILFVGQKQDNNVPAPAPAASPAQSVPAFAESADAPPAPSAPVPAPAPSPAPSPVPAATSASKPPSAPPPSQPSSVKRPPSRPPLRVPTRGEYDISTVQVPSEEPGPPVPPEPDFIIVDKFDRHKDTLRIKLAEQLLENLEKPGLTPSQLKSIIDFVCCNKKCTQGILASEIGITADELSSVTAEQAEISSPACQKAIGWCRSELEKIIKTINGTGAHSALANSAVAQPSAQPETLKTQPSPPPFSGPANPVISQPVPPVQPAASVTSVAEKSAVTAKEGITKTDALEILITKIASNNIKPQDLKRAVELLQKHLRIDPKTTAERIDISTQELTMVLSGASLFKSDVGRKVKSWVKEQLVTIRKTLAATREVHISTAGGASST